jgi:uncharacterized membrane protein YgcG
MIGNRLILPQDPLRLQQARVATPRANSLFAGGRGYRPHKSGIGLSTRVRCRQTLASMLSLAFLLAICPGRLPAYPDTSIAAQDDQAPRYTQQTADQLQQLVAPIALYPDSLVAQILAASTFPDQVVEADRWLQSHSDLTGDNLAQAVDPQSWDASVKALTAFPSVLGNMDKNLSWTSSLGDAYYNQQQDVLDAIQVMRQRAQDAGNLKTTPQQNVSTQDSNITIEPSDPDVVYVPAYDPWAVYGVPIDAWPGWYPYPGIWYAGPYLYFGPAFAIGFYGGYGWGWHRWGFDWHDRYATYDHDRYVSRSNTFYNRNQYYRGMAARGAGNTYRPETPPQPFNGNRQAARGYAEPQGESGVHSNAWSDYDRGGETRSYSSRGSSSFGGGGFGGGGGFHGGGGGGHHR